ncbi:MAG: hypothetical protein H7061_06220 [Bdellovibrionaceae bacterium]|nr:hypothetical protein [Bdellovibrio sp.]
MKNVIVWLDSKEAFVFALKTTGTEKLHLKKESINHHRRHKKDIHVDSNAEHYYHELALRLNGTDRLLLLGPGLSKTHFKNYLETHDANGLAKKIIAVVSLEHVTENQILAAGHKCFKEYDLFHDSI